MHISQLKESNYLTRADVGRGLLLTVKALKQENLAKQGQPEELKFVLFFNESEKPLVLNYTNAHIMAQVFGSEETDTWTGKQIVLFDDPNVSFAGKLVGGIRCRAPRKAPAMPPPPPPAPAPVAAVEEDDVPF